MSWIADLVAGLLTGVSTWWANRKAPPEPDPVHPPGFEAADARIAADLAARDAPTVKTPVPAPAKSNPY